MFAANLTFGVEIETSAPATLVSTHGLVVGAYHKGVQVPYLPQGWKDVAPYIVLLVVLLLKPEGLFGVHTRKKVYG